MWSGVAGILVSGAAGILLPGTAGILVSLGKSTFGNRGLSFD